MGLAGRHWSGAAALGVNVKTATGIVVVVVLVALGWWAVSYPIYSFRRWLSLRKKGFFVAHTRSHRVVYEEKVGAEVMTIRVPCTPVDELGRYRVIIPSRGKWQAWAPEWAKLRRDEVFNRVIKGVPPGWTELPADWVC